MRLSLPTVFMTNICVRGPGSCICVGLAVCVRVCVGRWLHWSADSMLMGRQVSERSLNRLSAYEGLCGLRVDSLLSPTPV